MTLNNEKNSKIYVDNIEQTLSVYSVPPASIHYGSKSDPNRGKVKRGILPSDITLNLSLELGHPHPEYQWKWLIKDQEKLWVEMWKDPITKQPHFIEINPSTGEDDDEEDEQQDDAASVADDDSEKEMIGYDEPAEEDEGGRDAFEEEDDYSEDEDRHGREPRLDKEREEVDDEVDVSELTEEESYLPLSFLLGKIAQWKIMQRACRSGFRLVEDMHKVVDRQLRILVDAAVYAVQDKGPVHDAIIKYGAQRKLF